MRIPRFVAGLVSAALLGLVPVSLAAAPAQAATMPTRVDIQTGGSSATYGQTIQVAGNVVAHNGQEWLGVPAGTAYLQELVPGGAWRTIDTDTYPSSFYFTVKARQNASYRVTYTGGAYREYTFPAANSATKGVKVKRKLKESIRKLVFKSTVSPSYKRKKVVIQVKAGKRWKTHRVIRTDRRSRFAIKLPATRKRTYFRAVIAGNKKFTKTVSRTAWTRRI